MMQPPKADVQPQSHPIIDAYSMEVSAKDRATLSALANHFAPGTTIAIPDLAGHSDAERLAATQTVRSLGLEPMPHIAARCVHSPSALSAFLQQANVRQCFVIAGNPSTPLGPFADSLALIETGVFEQSGIQLLGVGAHPEGHPIMNAVQRWAVLEEKCRCIVQHGMSPLIVTQFVFDADLVLAWLEALRERGIHHPVRIGVPGPAGIATLLRYAALCGVSASASILAQYGISIGKLLGTAGPDHFLERLSAGLRDTHGPVQLHFFPFGGLAQSLKWIEQYRLRHNTGL